MSRRPRTLASLPSGEPTQEGADAELEDLEPPEDLAPSEPERDEAPRRRAQEAAAGVRMKPTGLPSADAIRAARESRWAGVPRTTSAASRTSPAPTRPSRTSPDEVEDLIEAWSPTAAPAPEPDPGTTALEQEPLRLPEKIAARYKVVPSKHGQDLFRTNGDVPAIRDRGDQLRVMGPNEEAIRDMVEIAAGRGWSSMRVKGSETFRREAWIEATSRGLAVDGFRATGEDVRQALERSREHDGEVIEQGAGPDGPATPQPVEDSMTDTTEVRSKAHVSEVHVAARPSDRWFDLGELGAKLERLPSDARSGSYYLRLEIDEKTFKGALPEGQLTDRLQERGWVASDEPAPEGRVALETHQSAGTAREIARKLDPWFDEETMRAAHRPLREHGQPIRVYGLVPPNTEGTLLQLVEGVDLADKTRMQNTLAMAQSRAEQMRARSDRVLFAGNGNGVFHELTDRLTRRDDRPWGEVEAAAYVRGLMEGVGANPDDQVGRLTNDLGTALRAGDAEAADLAAAGILRDTESYGAEEAAAHPVMKEGVLERVRRDLAFAERAGNDVSPRDVALGQMIGAANLPAPAMAGDPGITRDNAQEVIEEAKRSLPFDLRADGSTPTVQVAQSVRAIERAFKATADAVGRPAESLLRPDKQVFLRLSGEGVSVDTAVVGYASAMRTDDDAAIQAVSGSVRSGRSFIHELGHAVDTSWGFTDEDRNAALERSGALAAIHDEIDRRFDPETRLDAREYYRDPREMFARMFEAHVVNVAREGGDRSLEGIGATHTTAGYDIGAPHGDLAATTGFVEEVRAIIERKLEAESTAELEKVKETERTAATAGPAR